MARPIQKTWEAYYTLMQLYLKPKEEVEQLKQAYFAGACVIFEAVSSMSQADEDAATRLLDDIMKEYGEFGPQIDMAYLRGARG